LVAYFRRTKELLVYFYRVAYREDGHFTRYAEGQTLLKEVIEPTREELKAIDDIFAAVRRRAVERRVGGRGSGYDGQSEVSTIVIRF
jgi:hypothetical protein